MFLGSVLRKKMKTFAWYEYLVPPKLLIPNNFET